MTRTGSAQPGSAPTPLTPATRLIGRHASGHGPTVVLVGGVHGNEPAGIHAARRVLDRLAQTMPPVFRGTLVALAGNLPALDAPPGTRYIDRDLNRSFTEPLLANPDRSCVECGQARALLDAIRAEQRAGVPMFVVDLHTTSAPSPPVIVLEDALPARRFAQRLAGSNGPALLLGFEEEVDGFLFDYVSRTLGCVSCVVEGGQHDDPASVDVLAAAAWCALDAAGVLPIEAAPGDPRAAMGGGEHAGRVYDLRHREPVGDASFEIVPGVAAHTPVRPGQTVAHRAGRPVTAPVRGEVFLPNRQPNKRPGDDGFFLIREISPGWLGLSGRLRQSGWLGACVMRLPGVHRCPGDPHALMVDADVAVSLKRQVFHLLGYRIVRRSAGSARVRSRVIGAVRGFLLAAWRRRTPSGIDDDRFWLVARRTLDRADDPR